MKSFPVHKKMILSGQQLEWIEFEKPCFHNFSSQGGRRKNTHSPRKKEYQLQKLRKARQNIPRLLYTNFKRGDKFLTLTFSNKRIRNDIVACKKEFKKFIQRLRRRYPHFKYIAIVEYMTNNGGDDGIHFHVVADLPKIPLEKLIRLWGNGNAMIKTIYNLKGLAEYLIKEFLPNPDHPYTRMSGYRTYMASRNIKRPLQYTNQIAERKLHQYTHQMVGRKNYDSPYHGKIRITKYEYRSEVRS